MILPRNDYLTVRRIEKTRSIILTDADKSIYGEVVAVGSGKWIEGEWWKVKGQWEWFDGYRRPMSVHPGQRILFNSKWNDFAGDHYDDLPVGSDKSLHIVQEAVIFS